MRDGRVGAAGTSWWPGRTGSGAPEGRSRRGGSRRWTLLLAGALIAMLAAASPAAANRPNVVVVTTDDQELGSITRHTMPKVISQLRRPGIDFNQFVVSGPLCCPARAVYLTGQYGHNNGVGWNNAGDPASREGAYGALRDKRDTLPVWMRRAGYRTAHVGRYLNLYARWTGDPSRVAPGWTDWHTVHEPYRYFDYVLHTNGGSRSLGERPRHYLTRVINRTAARMVRRHAGGKRPLFLTVDHLAPHTSSYRTERCGTSATPDPRDADAFRNAALPRPPSFNPEDVSGKPPFVTARERLGPEEVDAIANRYRCRLASLRAVDRGVGRLVKALRRKGELRNTAFIFTSDNGWFSGQHRIPQGKVIPYEESVRVPMILRPPASLRGPSMPRRSEKPVANVDLVPTILALAGAKPCRAGACRTLDGRSLLPLVRGRPGRWPGGRAILLALDSPGATGTAFTTCRYEGLRTTRTSYVEYRLITRDSGGRCEPSDFRELYDLRSDPHQLTNRSTSGLGLADPLREAELGRRLERLRSCAGIAGRDRRTEDRPFCE